MTYTVHWLIKPSRGTDSFPGDDRIIIGHPPGIYTYTPSFLPPFQSSHTRTYRHIRYHAIIITISDLLAGGGEGQQSEVLRNGSAILTHRSDQVELRVPVNDTQLVAVLHFHDRLCGLSAVLHIHVYTHRERWVNERV